MTETQILEKVGHSPTLNTMLMVEDTLKEAREVMTLAELKRRLPKKVMHQTLIQILDYLQMSGKIIIGTKGILWIYAEKKRIRWTNEKRNRDMNKPVKVILLNEADTEYKRLNETVGQQLIEGKENTQEMQLLRSIKQKRDLIKANPFYGDNIEKRKIPKVYEVTNLWRV
jgi:hypothetical protein